MRIGDRFAHYRRIVVELGMGDGRLLEALARDDGESLYIGIEIDKLQFEQARSRISAENAMLLQGSFELLVPTLPDESVDLIMAVLPDPAFIDRLKYDAWKGFYSQVLAKLKPGGTFRLVTELTDELLQPVTDSQYQDWVGWLRQAFAGLGFIPAGLIQQAPAEYQSRCLDQFRGDADRIKMVTIDFRKP
jgi:tRNA (guanine-N7-)-methyltransferase